MFQKFLSKRKGIASIGKEWYYLMQTAIYCGVSIEEQATEGFSIHALKDKLTKYASINDWDIVDYYVDDGISDKNITPIIK